MLIALALAILAFQESPASNPRYTPPATPPWMGPRAETPEEAAKRDQMLILEDERELRRKVRKFMQTFSQWTQLHAQNTHAATVDARNFKREQELFFESRKLFDELARQPALKRYSDRKR